MCIIFGANISQTIVGTDGYEQSCNLHSWHLAHGCLLALNSSVQTKNRTRDDRVAVDDTYRFDITLRTE